MRFFAVFPLPTRTNQIFFASMKIPNLVWLLPIAILVFTLAPSWSGEKISPAEAQKLIEANEAILVDVRERPEFLGGVAEPAALLPLSDLKGSRSAWKEVLAAHPKKIFILYCASGNRSGQAAKILQKEGYSTRNLGGFSSWKAAGLPVRQP